MKNTALVAIVALTLAGCASSGNQQLKTKLKPAFKIGFKKVKQLKLRLNPSLALLMLFHTLMGGMKSGSIPFAKVKLMVRLSFHFMVFFIMEQMGRRKNLQSYLRMTRFKSTQWRNQLLIRNRVGLINPDARPYAGLFLSTHSVLRHRSSTTP
jgi:hypothetical protein